MSEQPSGIYNTIASYIPGFGGGQQTTEEERPGSQNYKDNTATGQGHNTHDISRGHNPTEQSTEFAQHKHGGENSNNFPQTGKNEAIDTDGGYGAGRDVEYDAENMGNKNSGPGFGQYEDGQNEGGIGGQDTESDFSKKYGHPNAVAGSQAGSDESTGTRSQGGEALGSRTQSSEASQGAFQGDDGVRGAPIEGENLKGYAIGAPVGSGDTDNPRAPNDPTGQVSGSHLQYGPVHSDNRDQRGKGTHETTKGEGDSSFANVKRDDGRGNSEHVVTKTSKSHMSSTSTTQL